MSGFEGRFDALDQAIAALHRRFEAVDRRFESIDRRFEAMDRQIDALDQKISRQFVWLVGIQVSVLLAVVASLAGR